MSLLLLPLYAEARRAGLNFDLARLRLGLLGKEDAQHAVAALRPDVPHLHRRGEREAAAEAAGVALDAVIALPLCGVLELALAAQGERVALELDVDVVGIDLGQLDLQRDALAVLEDVDERRPGAACVLGLGFLAAGVRLLELLMEELVEGRVGAEAAEFRKPDNTGSWTYNPPADRAPGSARGRSSKEPQPPAART